MKRRNFVLYSAAAVAFNGVSIYRARSANPAQASVSLDAVGEIKKLQIQSGAFAGGYQVAPAGQVNWYFINIGLIGIVPDLSQSDLIPYIRTYLDLYLNRLETNATIKDVTFTGGDPLASFTLAASDSDDAYAATFLSLAAMYTRASEDWKWWHANLSKLKSVARNNLALLIKQNGLTRARQSGNNFGYLMDNCESYRGLRDFAEILRNAGDHDADYYDSSANRIIGGIRTHLYDAANRGFIWNDSLTSAESSFYPGTTCQVFPQAFGLVELSGYFANAWNYLNTKTPNWQDGHYDYFPWAILGFVAAQRGAFAQAQAQLQTVESLFISNRRFVPINELGFYQRTKSILTNANPG